MIFKVVAIYDAVSEVFSVPSFVPSVGSAVRGFGDECRKPSRPDWQNNLNLHPNDYTLHDLGDYDDTSGTFTATIPRRIAAAIDYVEKS